MSSILTNNSAMVALQTLQSVNSNLAKTQDMISTGKEVGSAKDNAAVFAISKVMESDVGGFKAISDSLALGESTVAVGRQAAETVTDLLTEMKGKIVAAQEENVDRSKIQTDIAELTKQIGSVVGSAQFNGLNLVNGSANAINANGNTGVDVLSSLDRASDGTVTASKIGVDAQNLSVTTGANTQDFSTATVLAAGEADLRITGAGITGVDIATAGVSTLTGTTNVTNGGGSETITIGQVAATDSFQIDIGQMQINTADGSVATGDRTFQYVASGTDGTGDVATNLAKQINAFFEAATDPSLAYSATVQNGNEIVITNGSTADIEVGVGAMTGGTPGSTAASGGLGALQSLDVTTNATGALSDIEGLIQKSIDAAAAFGSAEGRIATQSEFVGKLTDSLTSGIGSLVDANMEEASARLQALQVQQQLATQSLSIANQAPQALLSLFRG
ncbi:flagellin N-terminal helical domain-containing protein [Roseovarius sp. D22-M7]|uniref:flagellin N-terminal helical domain-containing protein n=1 Tax=Roseovarius sp. D22-M7 TaxID=3127116 RepID=UPI0030101D4E